MAKVYAVIIQHKCKKVLFIIYCVAILMIMYQVNMGLMQDRQMYHWIENTLKIINWIKCNIMKQQW